MTTQDKMQLEREIFQKPMISPQAISGIKKSYLDNNPAMKVSATLQKKGKQNKKRNAHDDSSSDNSS